MNTLVNSVILFQAHVKGTGYDFSSLYSRIMCLHMCECVNVLIWSIKHEYALSSLHLSTVFLRFRVVRRAAATSTINGYFSATLTTIACLVRYYTAVALIVWLLINCFQHYQC